MARSDHGEDALIQVLTAEYLDQELGWDSVMAQDEGAGKSAGPNSLLGRSADTEVVLTRDVFVALLRQNTGLPDAA